MATPPDSPYGDFMMTFETAKPVKHTRPVKLEELCKQTKFTRQEIRIMYRGFKQECPEGVVQEDTFKEIYAKFFPHGNSSIYAHHIFKAFDLNSNGHISFRDLLISLSQLLRGSAYDKLQWTFQLYDVNGDGCITKAELTDIVSSVHELMGRTSGARSQPAPQRALPSPKALLQKQPQQQQQQQQQQQIPQIQQPSQPQQQQKECSFEGQQQAAASLDQQDKLLKPEPAKLFPKQQSKKIKKPTKHDSERDRSSSLITLSLSPSSLTEQTMGAASSEDIDGASGGISIEDRQTRDHVDRLFKKFDLNSDGVITIDEFIQSCMQDDAITESLKVFEGL